MVLYTAFDNRGKSPFLWAWGFSVFIDTGDLRILFDSGSNPKILLHNLSLLKIFPRDIDMLFLSHFHWDHIGGFSAIVGENPDLKVVLGASFSKHFIEDIKRVVKDVIIIGDSPLQIEKGIYSTGEMGHGIKEHSLIIEAENKVILVVGCSHPKIVNIAKKTMRIVNKKIDLIK